MEARDIAFLISFSKRTGEAKPDRLVQMELLAKDGIGWTVTERGQAYVNSLCNVPLPMAVGAPTTAVSALANGSDEWSQRE